MRSKLFVPASRPELFAKAMASPADAVSFDLQDAVEASQKWAARVALERFLGTLRPGHGKLVVVRVNDIPAEFEHDIAAVVRPGVDVLNLPKVQSAEAVRLAAQRIEQVERARALPRPLGLLITIETPRALRVAAEIAGAHPRVVGLQIGFGDLFAPLGIAGDHDVAKAFVRVAVRMAAAEVGLPAYDAAYVRVDDAEGFAREAHAAHALGFAGKSCIHPSQVALANAAFRPSAGDIEHARRVVAAAEAARARGVGAFVVDGRLVDGPFITLAEHTMALARRLGDA